MFTACLTHSQSGIKLLKINAWKLTFSSDRTTSFGSCSLSLPFQSRNWNFRYRVTKHNISLFVFSSNYLPHQNCQNRNFLSVGDGGRLGNLMSQYATLWAASKLVPTKVIPVITSTMHTALTKIFPNISIPKMPECKGSYNWTYIDIKVSYSELQLGWVQEWWWIWNFCLKCHLLQYDVAIKEFCQV